MRRLSLAALLAIAITLSFVPATLADCSSVFGCSSYGSSSRYDNQGTPMVRVPSGSSYGSSSQYDPFGSRASSDLYTSGSRWGDSYSYSYASPFGRSTRDSYDYGSSSWLGRESSSSDSFFSWWKNWEQEQRLERIEREIRSLKSRLGDWWP
jgi:hypothetical protein